MSDFVISLNGIRKEIEISENSSLKLDGKNFHYELTHLEGANYLLKLNNKMFSVNIEKKDSENFIVNINGSQFLTIARTALEEKASKLIEQKSKLNHQTDVKAPMPGMILKIKTQNNDEVSQGDSIMILEAMKMENDLRAPVSGKIKKIYVQEGTAVEKGTLLYSII